MTGPLVTTSVPDITPLNEGFDAVEIVPEPLKPALLEGAGAVMAVLDGAKCPGLQQMCERDGLVHKCLYTGPTFEENADVAPWLVQLNDEARLLRNLMTQGEAPWHFWDRQIGIFLRSNHRFDEVWAHLRKFTLVQDEVGDRLFFRFFEPDFITTVLQQCTPGEIVGFFDKIDRLIAIERHWPDTWTGKVLHVVPDHGVAPDAFVLSEPKWRAMQQVEFIRRGRAAALDHNIAAKEREDFVALAVWLQWHKHTYEGNWVEAFDVFRQLSAEQLAPIWQSLADGNFSMSYILYEVRRQFGLEQVTE